MMTIKKILSYTLVLGVLGLGLVSCDKDDDDSFALATGVEAVTTLPEAARTTLTAISGAQVSNTKTYSVLSERGAKYESYLTLSGVSLELEFDALGNWLDVEAQGYAAIPESMLTALGLPQTMLDYLRTNALLAQVEEVERTVYGYKVDLRNDISLQFNQTGGYVATYRD
ncbi:MAG: PepSY-like domain-containing protein [Porphyromonas sp.]|nr:PepSY-like domain-containing protein [Porphyromonas sp.]